MMQSRTPKTTTSLHVQNRPPRPNYTTTTITNKPKTTTTPTSIPQKTFTHSASKVQNTFTMGFHRPIQPLQSSPTTLQTRKELANGFNHPCVSLLSLVLLHNKKGQVRRVPITPMNTYPSNPSRTSSSTKKRQHDSNTLQLHKTMAGTNTKSIHPHHPTNLQTSI